MNSSGQLGFLRKASHLGFLYHGSPPSQVMLPKLHEHALRLRSKFEAPHCCSTCGLEIHALSEEGYTCKPCNFFACLHCLLRDFIVCRGQVLPYTLVNGAVACSAGLEHSAIITADHKLTIFGANHFGQLGQGQPRESNKHNSQHSVQISPCLLPDDVISVSCGWYHTCAVLASGKIFSWGCGDFGATGHDDHVHRSEPCEIQSLLSESVTIIACGSFHSLCVTRAGKLYSWGHGAHGELGHGDNLNRSKPKLILNLVRDSIADIGCGSAHTIVVTDDGIIYSWGSNKYGQLGCVDNVAMKNIPGIVESDFLSTKVAAGGSHSLIISDSSKLYSFGDNRRGQLGCGDCFCRTRPAHVLLPRRVTLVSAGLQHSCAADDFGCIYEFGLILKDRGGKVEGNVKERIPHTLHTLPEELSTTASHKSQHCVCLASGGYHSLSIMRKPISSQLSSTFFNSRSASTTASLPDDAKFLPVLPVYRRIVFYIVAVVTAEFYSRLVDFILSSLFILFHVFSSLVSMGPSELSVVNVAHVGKKSDEVVRYSVYGDDDYESKIFKKLTARSIILPPQENRGMSMSIPDFQRMKGRPYWRFRLAVRAVIRVTRVGNNTRFGIHSCSSCGRIIRSRWICRDCQASLGCCLCAGCHAEFIENVNDPAHPPKHKFEFVRSNNSNGKSLGLCKTILAVDGAEKYMALVAAKQERIALHCEKIQNIRARSKSQMNQHESPDWDYIEFLSTETTQCGEVEIKETMNGVATKIQALFRGWSLRHAVKTRKWLGLCLRCDRFECESSKCRGVCVNPSDYLIHRGDESDDELDEEKEMRGGLFFEADGGLTRGLGMCCSIYLTTAALLVHLPLSLNQDEFGCLIYHHSIQVQWYWLLEWPGRCTNSFDSDSDGSSAAVDIYNIMFSHLNIGVLQFFHYVIIILFVCSRILRLGSVSTLMVPHGLSRMYSYSDYSDTDHSQFEIGGYDRDRVYFFNFINVNFASASGDNESGDILGKWGKMGHVKSRTRSDGQKWQPALQGFSFFLLVSVVHILLFPMTLAGSLQSSPHAACAVWMICSEISCFLFLAFNNFIKLYCARKFKGLRRIWFWYSRLAWHYDLLIFMYIRLFLQVLMPFVSSFEENEDALTAAFRSEWAPAVFWVYCGQSFLYMLADSRLGVYLQVACLWSPHWRYDYFQIMYGRWFSAVWIAFAFQRSIPLMPVVLTLFTLLKTFTLPCIFIDVYYTQQKFISILIMLLAPPISHAITAILATKPSSERWNKLNACGFKFSEFVLPQIWCCGIGCIILVCVLTIIQAAQSAAVVISSQWQKLCNADLFGGGDQENADEDVCDDKEDNEDDEDVVADVVAEGVGGISRASSQVPSTTTSGSYFGAWSLDANTRRADKGEIIDWKQVSIAWTSRSCAKLWDLAAVKKSERVTAMLCGNFLYDEFSWEDELARVGWKEWMQVGITKSKAQIDICKGVAVDDLPPPKISLIMGKIEIIDSLPQDFGSQFIGWLMSCIDCHSERSAADSRGNFNQNTNASAAKFQYRGTELMSRWKSNICYHIPSDCPHMNLDTRTLFDNLQISQALISRRLHTSSTRPGPYIQQNSNALHLPAQQIESVKRTTISMSSIAQVNVFVFVLNVVFLTFLTCTWRDWGKNHNPRHMLQCINQGLF